MTAEQLLQFWFADSLQSGSALAPHVTRWFQRDDRFDAAIIDRFQADILQAGNGAFDAWAETARGRLALIILLDQLSRNAFRQTPLAYAFDVRAAELCLEGMRIGDDLQLDPIERHFFYMPLFHSELLSHQRRSVACFEHLHAKASADQVRHFARWVALARRQHAVIRRFGRVPHRNSILGRPTTFSERIYLAGDVLRHFVARVR